MRRILLLLIVMMIPLAARAEYRVYLLAITSPQTGQARTFTSTLDDIQYVGYFPLNKDETIAIQDTWMCRGGQGNFQHLCPNPKASSNRTPASTTPPR